jgi:hypothetical protein
MESKSNTSNTTTNKPTQAGKTQESFFIVNFNRFGQNSKSDASRRG